MRQFFLSLRSKKLITLGLGLLALILGVVFWRAHTGKNRPKNPLLESPSLALQSLQAKVLYYNAAAKPWLLAQRPDLLAGEDKDPRSERSRSFAQAVLEPQLFRKLDRQYRFDTLLFVGDPSQYRPLLDHLVNAKDWKLTYLDHASLVFRRDNASEWKTTQLDPLRAKFPTPSDQALFLSLAAGKLIALRENETAKGVLDQAAALDDDIPELWSSRANYHLNRGEWQKALEAVDRVLNKDPHFLPALATKTQIFFATKRFSEAYDLSKELIESHPDDPNLLFYHAKIAHQAHAYGGEIEVLQKLIAVAERESRPSSGYRIYLAQAYAAKGDAKPAIEQFELALRDPDLSLEQRKFAAETLAQVKSRSGD